MNLDKDNRIVMTLDAGGTNFVFSAMQGGNEVVDHITVPAEATDLNEMLIKIIEGFESVKKHLGEEPAAISFAFPGPAEYPLGIIGDLANLPLFKGGVALGPMLEDKFNIPVYINNDGDLFAYGEAIAGLLPHINKLLEEAGNPKRYHNLFGATLGTGFGGGIVSHSELFTGDNSAQAEINRLRNKVHPFYSVEESVSIRGIKKAYSREARIDEVICPTPQSIYEIAMGQVEGNKEAAVKAYDKFAVAAGDALANVATLIDGLIVLGGGLSGAWPLFLQKMVKEMNKKFDLPSGDHLDRLEVRVFNLENDRNLQRFLHGNTRSVAIPFTDKKITYDPLKRIGVGITKLGTSRATAIGAYAFALNELDKNPR